MEPNEMHSELTKLDDRVNKLAEDVAAQKTIGELIKYLVYFWAAISAALGLFGWSKFSDIDKSIEQQVQLQLPRDKQDFAKFREMVGEAEVLHKNYEQLARDYEQSVEALKLAKTVGVDFDIEGKVLALMVDSTKIKQASKANIEDEATELFDPKWRKDAIATVTIFKDSLAKKTYPADFIFNVTQICKRLDQFQLAEQLTKAAFDKDPSPPIKALYYSSLVKNSSGKHRDDAFRNLMSMVASLEENSPEIIIAEAWNAAEDQRRYTELVDSIDKLYAKNKTPPSYVFIIKAQALLRQSKPGSIQGAEQALSTALSLLKNETALSSWFKSTLREYSEITQVIQKTKMANELFSQQLN